MRGGKKGGTDWSSGKIVGQPGGSGYYGVL